MHVPFSGRPSDRHRFQARSLRLAVAALLVLITRTAFAADVTGHVVDSDGRPLPRAYVRLVNAANRQIDGAFTDQSGRFVLTNPTSESCRVEAALTGFQTSEAACGVDLHLVLGIAAIRETVIVTATLTDAPTGQIGGSSTIVTAGDLERLQKPLVADLLAATPGAMLLRNGGPGTVTSLFVRGGESDYNKVLVDGVPLNEPGGTFYLNNLTTENLDRVEIVRGAYSSLFGSDAMAGVIQLFTKRADRTSARPRVTAQVDGGTYGTLHATTSVAGAAKRFDYSAGVARLDSDNRVPNSAMANTTFSGSLGATLGAGASLRFVGRTEREQVGTPGTTAFGRPDRDAFFERHDGIGAVSFDHQLTSAVRQRAQYSLAQSTQQSTNLVADPPYTASYQGRTALSASHDFLNDTSNEFRRHHASYQADMRVTTFDSRAGEHLLTVLVDWDGERARATNRLFGGDTVNGRNNFGVSVQDQLLWQRAFLTVGGRVEHNASFGTEFVPRGSLVFVAREGAGSVGQVRVRASAGKGIKEPTLPESFSVSPFFLGNRDLKPERSISAEIGVEQRLSRDRAKIELTYFDNRFHDVIELITLDPATYEGQYFNTGATRARGIELGAEAAPAPFVRARAAYTLLDGRVTDSAVPNDRVFRLGNTLFRRPRNSGAAGVTLYVRRITADVNGTFVGRFVDSDFGLFDPPISESPGHTAWDLRVAGKISRQLTGLLMIDNLTNADYSEPLGYQPLLRVIRVGVRVQF